MGKQGRSTAFDLEVIEERPGFLSFLASGKRAAEVFANEAGGHRWQRVPPTEKRGRVHTSTITVAVMSVPEATDFRLNERDLDIHTTRGSGPGGQHRNKTETEVEITHRPTGLKVRCGAERSQHRNKQLAMEILAARLAENERQARIQGRNMTRREQIGSGQRGDKIRTIRTQDNTVRCELTGKTMPYTQYAKGHILF
jgi:peptide chain release factor 1